MLRAEIDTKTISEKKIETHLSQNPTFDNIKHSLQSQTSMSNIYDSQSQPVNSNKESYKDHQYASNSTVDISIDINIYNYESNIEPISFTNRRYFMAINPLKEPKGMEAFSDEFLSYRTQNIYLKGPTIPDEILEDVYYSLINDEREFKSVYGYMSQQTDINEKMRAVLINWLIEVHMKFKLRDETLFIAVTIIDRYLGIAYIKKEYLQLLGISALFIACKYEEVHSLELSDFVFISDNSYTVQEVLSMEKHILLVLDYKLTFPTILHFFELLCLNFFFNEREYHFGKYLIELFLLDYRMNSTLR